jgi:S-adenosyl methyltransferase
LMLVAVLHFIHGEGAAEAIVGSLLDRLAPGSFLVASNATKDFATPMGETVYKAMVASGKLDMWLRTRAEFAQVFDGLELVEPGVVICSEWRAEDEPKPRPQPAEISVYGGVGRKP